MLSAILFDIDGTLIDSNDFHAKAWEKAFASHGKPVPFEEIRKHVGEGGDQLLPYFLTKSEIEKKGEAIKKSHQTIFHREYLTKVKPFPKVRELFQRLRSLHVRIVLASSCEKNEAEAFKEIAQITDLVDHTTTADDAEKSKPHPGILDAAMDSLGNPRRKSVLFVGDSPYDVIAATKAKLPIAGVLCGGFTAHQLRIHGCEEVYRDPAEILKNLNRVAGTPHH